MKHKTTINTNKYPYPPQVRYDTELKYKDSDYSDSVDVASGAAGDHGSGIATIAADITKGTGRDQITGAKGRYYKISAKLLLRNYSSTRDYQTHRVLVLRCKYDSGGPITATDFQANEYPKIFGRNNPDSMSRFTLNCSDYYDVLYDASHNPLSNQWMPADFTIYPSNIFDISTGVGLCYICVLTFHYTVLHTSNLYIRLDSEIRVGFRDI